MDTDNYYDLLVEREVAKAILASELSAPTKQDFTEWLYRRADHDIVEFFFVECQDDESLEDTDEAFTRFIIAAIGNMVFEQMQHYFAENQAERQRNAVLYGPEPMPTTAMDTSGGGAALEGVEDYPLPRDELEVFKAMGAQEESQVGVPPGTAGVTPTLQASAAIAYEELKEAAIRPDAWPSGLRDVVKQAADGDPATPPFVHAALLMTRSPCDDVAQAGMLTLKSWYRFGLGGDMSGAGHFRGWSTDAAKHKVRGGTFVEDLQTFLGDVLHGLFQRTATMTTTALKEMLDGWAGVEAAMVLLLDQPCGTLATDTAPRGVRGQFRHRWHAVTVPRKRARSDGGGEGNLDVWLTAFKRSSRQDAANFIGREHRLSKLLAVPLDWRVAKPNLLFTLEGHAGIRVRRVPPKVHDFWDKITAFAIVEGDFTLM